MEIPTTMKAARMHEVGGPLVLEELETPRPGPYDVLVRVKACGIVPNLANILAKWSTWYPEYALPALPAIFGLDPAGEIVAVGEHVFGFSVGQRVYGQPGAVLRDVRRMHHERPGRVQILHVQRLFRAHKPLLEDL